MRLYNIQENNEQVNFVQAIQRGLGRKQGLFFPIDLPQLTLTEIEEWLKMDFLSRSARILSTYIGEEFSFERILKCVTSAFNFPAPVVQISKDIATLELFHGPTLAFKDFGGRLMSRMLSEIGQRHQMTILTATSGDTGAAVAHAFYGLENVHVVILYPRGKISPLQEKLFCTLGGNIHTVALDSDFDTCQSIVKQSFDDEELTQTLGLNSANWINISRLLAQICYYFEAVAQLPQWAQNKLVISVPSGNFGNLTAGLLAKTLGLPVKRFIASTNSNDTIPRFMSTGKWRPNPVVETLSNAMDISKPSNWQRVEELFRRKNWTLDSILSSVGVDDDTTADTLREIAALGYVSEPHSATAYRVLRDQLQTDEFGLFISTAHPAKFKHVVENILSQCVHLPSALAIRTDLPVLSNRIPADFSSLRDFLLDRIK